MFTHEQEVSEVVYKSEILILFDTRIGWYRLCNIVNGMNLLKNFVQNGQILLNTNYIDSFSNILHDSQEKQ